VSMSPAPAWDLWLDAQFGPPIEGPGLPSFIFLATNVVVGTNPPYTIEDFLSFYPKWGGTPAALSVSMTQNSATITVNNPPPPAIPKSSPVCGPGIPDGAIVIGVNSAQITLNVPASASSATGTVNIYNAMPIPARVLLAYINLASAHLVQARWFDDWEFAIALFVAHFATLYAQSDGDPNSTVGMIAGQGISTGITTAHAAGDVSESFQPVPGLEEFAAWNLTTYGQQLATFARGIGSGPMFLY
jgi:Protein of unknown function (DUF4054)